jgi:hypothetical protein
MLFFSFLDMIAFAYRHSFFYAGLNVACSRFQKYNFFTNNNPVNGLKALPAITSKTKH